MNDPALSEVLRASALVACTPADYQRLKRAVSRVRDWGGFPEAAESHRLSPLVHHHFSEAGIDWPVDVRQQLVGLAIRHREANRRRLVVLAEILQTFDQASIETRVLKGPALAHLLYPAPGLRPFSDFDLLVEPSAATRAQMLLASLGFNAPVAPRGRALVDHHHLPMAVKFWDWGSVEIEIHRDALSRDSGASLTMDHLSGTAQAFSVEGRTAWTLGHLDMLHHLARHAAECSPLFRLICAADIIGYATKFRAAIPWAELRERHPFVMNALSLLHLVTPLPGELLEYVTPSRSEGLRGIGTSFPPLADIVRWDRPLRDMGRDLLAPSDWWLRLYYGLDDHASLGWHRSVTHPLWVGRWLARRAGTSVRWWVGSAAD